MYHITRPNFFHPLSSHTIFNSNSSFSDMILSSSLMSTRSFLVILALLVNLKDSLVAGKKVILQRPKDLVPTRILQYGCIPFKDFQCPPLMECLVDLNYAYYGQCYCKHSFLKRFKAPHDTGSDLYHPSRLDCVNMGSINIWSSLVMGLIFISSAKLMVSVVLTLYRVWKHGGLKANSTNVAMILLAFSTGVFTVQTLDYTLNRAGWDPHYKFHDHTFFQTQTGITFTLNLYIIECVCTWFDLWQRSVSMSKKTSMLTIIVRWLIRAYAITNATMYGLGAFSLITTSQGKNITSKLIKLSVWIVSSITFVFGLLIRRVLCKNMKDVTNPNWKAADAIQTTALTSILCSLLFQGGQKMLLSFCIFASWPVAIHDTVARVSQFVILVQYKCWFDYLLYCQRRYLESYDTDRISNYFGLSTIGRKQSSAIMSSTTSSMQMMSSVSSVASSSTVEADQPAPEKGTVA